MVSVTALTAPLALLPFEELDRDEADLVVRERFALAAARERGWDLRPDDPLVARGFAADDAPDFAAGDDRLALLALLLEPARRVLAWVGRPLDERALEATMGPSFWVGVQALYPGRAFAHAALRRRPSGGGAGAPRASATPPAGGPRSPRSAPGPA
jgi:hypothetical protein